MPFKRTGRYGNGHIRGKRDARLERREMRRQNADHTWAADAWYGFWDCSSDMLMFVIEAEFWGDFFGGVAEILGGLVDAIASGFSSGDS